MTLEQIAEAKRAAEMQIRDILLALHARTGMNVDLLHIITETRVPHGEQIVAVKLRLTVPG